MLDNTLIVQAQISNLKLEILNLKIKNSVLTAIFMNFMQKSDPSLTEEDINYLFENTTNRSMEVSPIKEEIAALKKEQTEIEASLKAQDTISKMLNGKDISDEDKKASLEWLDKMTKHTEGSESNE